MVMLLLQVVSALFVTRLLPWPGSQSLSESKAALLLGVFPSHVGVPVLWSPRVWYLTVLVTLLEDGRDKSL